MRGRVNAIRTFKGLVADLREDTKYGGVKPRRNYNGMRYNNGFSDHLPLVLRMVMKE